MIKQYTEQQNFSTKNEFIQINLNIQKSVREWKRSMAVPRGKCKGDNKY